MSRVLFVMLHPGYIRYFEPGLLALAEAGHDIHVAFEVSRDKLGESETAARLASLTPRITCGPAPERTESVRTFLARADRSATRSGEADRPAAREAAWESLATTVRLMSDYCRFFEPAFAGAPALRYRAEKRLPLVYRPIVRSAASAGAWTRARLAAALAATERAIPTIGAIDRFLQEQKPDLLLVTPLIELGSQQVDYVKSARRLGIRSGLCVASWDNLTSKGLVRVVPDHVIVWNEAQRAEAVTLHGVAPGQVVVTGAALFDHWFTARPSRSRGEFCRMVGLDPARSFLLYVGSSSFIAPEEVPFVERWLSHVRRARSGAVSTVGVLLRPHPANARQWRAFDEAAEAGVGLWPPVGADTNGAGFRRDYLDSLWHCAAVVGINTSAQIEAAIVGRPVYTVRTAEFAHSQGGSLHFQYLAGAGGPVHVGEGLDEHVGQLTRLLEQGAPDDSARRAFVASFVRPHGVERPAAPIFAEAVSELCQLGPTAPPAEPGAGARLARPLVFVAARVAFALAEDRPLWVYPLRPVIAGGVWALAVVHGPDDGWASTARLAAKRVRRTTWWLRYESSRYLSRGWRQLKKRLQRGRRFAGRVARRAGGRQP